MAEDILRREPFSKTRRSEQKDGNVWIWFKAGEQTSGMTDYWRLYATRLSPAVVIYRSPGPEDLHLDHHVSYYVPLLDTNRLTGRL